MFHLKKVANPSEMLGSERTGFCFRKHGGQINSCSIYWIWSVYLYLSNSVFVNISQWSLPRGSDWKWKWKWRRRVQSQSWLCFVGMTVRSSLCPRLASSQRSPTRCHSTNSSLMPVWCVLNCVCVWVCVHSCTVLRHWRARRVPRRYCERDEEMWEKKGGW